jgi:hypothetical protein
MTDVKDRIGSDDELVRFAFELGQLRTEARHGWNRIYENPESVAEHTQRARLLIGTSGRISGSELGRNDDPVS